MKKILLFAAKLLIVLCWLLALQFGIYLLLCYLGGG